ncbi:MAG: enoyl-CoA hydratase/isomerase family protein [Candidatus Methanolliviera hydrocarbonicum]|uniref:Enoyl-CoA hydratase/isomerase family protein n=1 Tax=Candidatus Methanolliviera hydrocarbonicum TaxID=2491085 RepID=A0A520KYX5_9EURY|nr:MAG: enoyl-CoA hydratase/isomerase family protein [Candidatus Methanolliviera hydrocarbonicum]
MEYETLKYEEKDATGILTLNRPKRLNAINEKMVDELEGFWMKRMYDLHTRVIILTGAGEKGFCGGLDMKEDAQKIFNLKPSEIYRFQTRISKLQLLMRQVPQPIICAIHKSAVGGGFSFAMASDVRIITPDARFSAAYINIGLGGADVGSSYFLPRLIGAGRAYEFLLTGDFMDADEALKLGFVSRVVPHEKLMATAMEMANKMTSKNPLGLRLTKEAINQNIDAGGLEQALHMENRNQVMCILLANKL